MLVGNGVGQSLRVNSTFSCVNWALDCKEVVSQPSGNGGISGRWNEMMKTGGWFANILKKS